jgi:UDPglucose--hexose-1-phosphate uridylyltransferase
VNLTHRRFNPLTNQWVLVSPKRTARPWQGDVEEVPEEYAPTYDPNCYLCPGNTRANGEVNPNYKSTFVFDNDFPALTMDSENSFEESEHPLFKSKHEKGICRVVCFSPNHSLTLPELSQTQVEDVLETWKKETVDLFGRKDIAYVQVFENKGAQMGCSNPHPHSQIWSQSQIPNEPLAELKAQTTYINENATPLLVDYVAEELKRKDRIITSNDHFTVLVPFWAVWPFETLIIAHRPVAYLQQLHSEEISAFAELIKIITSKYDNLFKISFPYSMGIHQAPNDHASHPEWVLHAHFYPPLLRSAYVRKFMVGYEMLAMPQRDITPEEAAERLRKLLDDHYKFRR